MILEIAILDVISGRESDFQNDFEKTAEIRRVRTVSSTDHFFREKTGPAFCDRCSNPNFGESVYDLSYEAFNCRMTNRESGLQ